MQTDLIAWIVLVLLAFTSITADRFDNVLNRRLRRLQIRGAAVAFYDGYTMNEPIVRGYGKVDSAGSASVTPDTAFLLASVSKVFAGATVSVLLDKGIIGSLDDNICDVLPDDWDSSACRHPDFPEVDITWRMFVTHRTSLIRDIPAVRDADGKEVLPAYGPTGGYFGQAAGNPTCPLTDAQGFYRDFLTNKVTETSVGSGVLVGGGTPLNWYDIGGNNAWAGFAPGSRSEYSNVAMGYLAALVELASGESFADFSRTNIFEKLGMANTEWFREDFTNDTVVAHPVESYGRHYWEDIGFYCFIDFGSGQLYSSANDLAKFAMSMMEYGAPTLWSEAIGQQAQECQERNPDGSQPDECEWGMNWSLLSNDDKFSNIFSWLRHYRHYDWTGGIMHDGSEAGSQTQLVILPKAEVFAVVILNTETRAGIAAQRVAGQLPGASRGFIGGLCV